MSELEQEQRMILAEQLATLRAENEAWKSLAEEMAGLIGGTIESDSEFETEYDKCAKVILSKHAAMKEARDE